MAVVFEELLRKAEQDGISYRKSRRKAATYFQNRARRETDISSTKLLRSAQDRRTSIFTPGKMYFYRYDPKYKRELPYYDTFPLVFPLYIQGPHMLGLNMHYLPPRLRAKLMDALWTLRTDSKYDERTTLQLSYEVLNGMSKFKLFRPCLKKYLLKNVRSKLIEMNANEWDIALMLPVADFKKASQRKVWNDARKMAGKKRR